ncbi:hypothetical protein [Alkalimonas mucilaginosa]|uniref:Uncharacterized protein n=1 Tax=Alkalimonas mucilaginosa TaxID=3057676 RepID=A0ABU7JDW3_9GAMM|nr:hypothetical protein [Alkalimonas sp. MEB004]MEE2023877.1 hypothetical protein [Alkalimonas sp. MEB004]
MKRLSKIVFCLPLLMLNLEHKPNDNSYLQLNEPLNLLEFRLVLNTASAARNEEEDEEEDDWERIGVIGTPPGDWDWDDWDDDDWYDEDDECTNISLCGDDDGDHGDSSPTPEKVCGNGYTRTETQQHMIDSIVQLSEAEGAWRSYLNLEAMTLTVYLSQVYGYRAGSAMGGAYRIVMDQGLQMLSSSARNRLQAEYNAALATCD